jgi:metacaspase-1
MEVLGMAAIGETPGARAKGLSVHVGVNVGDMRHYPKFAELVNCVNDAEAMAALAESQGYKVQALLADEAGTRDAVKRAFSDAAALLKPGDAFLFTYSGHGAQIKIGAQGGHEDVEADQNDETWCLYDGMLLDDEVYQMWNAFAQGVRIFTVLDCCHSETSTREAGIMPRASVVRRKRQLPLFDQLNTRRKNFDFYAQVIAGCRGAKELPVSCSVKVLTACKDHEVADDGIPGENGLFTAALLVVWDNGNFQGSGDEFYTQIAEFLDGSGQTPGKDWQGSPDPAFAALRPFTI